MDYDLDSEEEWLELNCDDLDNEQLMLDEDYDNGDAEELKAEGFIVADDEIEGGSQCSIEDDDQTNSRKDLIRKAMERSNLQARHELKPYIHYYTNYDISEFKAVAFKRNSNLINVSVITGRGFPISVIKCSKKEEEKRMTIKDNLEGIVQLIHGSSISKKDAHERITSKFTYLRKSHVDNFLKDCITKEKHSLDPKFRLYAKVGELEKYGAGHLLIEKLPLILEEKLDKERA